MAFPSKPHSLKVISGSRQPDPPSIELPLVDEIPPPPEWLKNKLARDEWNRLASILHANNLLTEACLSVLAVLCAVTGAIAKELKAGRTPTGHMVAQFRALSNDFGLPPGAQGKVKPGAETKKANAFAGIGRKPA